MKFKLEPDYKELRREILQHLRQTKTCEELDLKFDLRPGVWQSWEKGSSVISWTEFLSVTTKHGLELSFSMINGYTKTDLSDYVSFLNHLMIGVTQEEFCRRVDFSRSLFNRWLAREVSPSLEQMLQILTRYRAYLFIFLKNNFPIEEFPSLAQYRECMHKVHAACFDHPQGIYIITYLISSAMKEGTGTAEEKISKAFNLPADQANIILQQIVDSNAVVLDNEEFIPYLINVPLVFAPRTTQDTMQRVLQNVQFLQYLNEQQIISAQLGVQARVVQLVTRTQYNDIVAIMRKAYQKVWQVCYEENYLQEKTTAQKNDRQVAMMSFFLTQDMGRVLLKP